MLLKFHYIDLTRDSLVVITFTHVLTSCKQRCSWYLDNIVYLLRLSLNFVLTDPNNLNSVLGKVHLLCSMSLTTSTQKWSQKNKTDCNAYLNRCWCTIMLYF